MRWFAATAAALALIGIWAAATGGLAPVTARAKRIPIYAVKRPQPWIALTFNGAWGPDYGDEILDTLDRFDAVATWFVLDAWLEQNPDTARRVAATGHELAMHSSTHPDFTRISPERMRAEIRANCHHIIRVAGVVPRLFRAPSGAYDDRTMAVVEDELGFVVVQWSVDSIDWQRPTVDQLIARVNAGLGPGAIVLFHTNVPETVRALPAILALVADRGLVPVTVSRLLLSPPYRIDQRGVQSRPD